MGRTLKTWKAFYDPLFCIHMGCTYCDILEKELDVRRGNVFYNLRKSWIEKGEGLFPDQRKTVVEKGRKLLDRTTSLTICEAIIIYGRQQIEERIRINHHSELFVNKTLEILMIFVNSDAVCILAPSMALTNLCIVTKIFAIL